MSGDPDKAAIVVSENGRRFAAIPAAVLAFLVNDREQILLLAHPRRGGAWEVVSGAVKGAETVLEAVLRETREELGPGVTVRPLGTVHAYSYRYDRSVPSMLSIAYLLAFEGGQIRPSDDMTGSDYRWWSLKDIDQQRPALAVPHQHTWLLERAVSLYRLWRNLPLPEMTGDERH